MDLITHKALPYEARGAFYSNFLGISDARPAALQRLRVMMTETLWPEMLIDESSQADPHHPIAVARDYGIIDFSQVAGKSGVSPPSTSPPSSPSRRKIHTPHSPVSVANH
jgi:hypothetical protein